MWQLPCTMLALLPPRPPVPELYFLLMNQALNKTYNLTAVEALFRRGRAAGYQGVVLYDHNLGALGSPRLREDYLSDLVLDFYFFPDLGLEMGSRRPGRCLKRLLVAIGFTLTDYGPVGSHGDPIRGRKYGFATAGICCVETADMCCVETADMCRLETADVCCLETADMCCLETTEMCCLETADMCCVETADMCCIQTTDMCCLETAHMCCDDTADMCCAETANMRCVETADMCCVEKIGRASCRERV